MGVPARWQGCALDSVELPPATGDGCAALVNTSLHNTERMKGECQGTKPGAEMHMTTPRCGTVPTPVGFSLGWAQEPDPLCGRRVSICPQPTRAPRGEVMALGPSWRVGPARAVAGGPPSLVPEWRARGVSQGRENAQYW